MTEKWSDVPVGTVHDHGCQCWPHVSLDHYEAVALAEYRQGKAAVAAERARIRARVEGLPQCPAGDEEGERWWLDRDEVLAAIDGEADHAAP